MNIIHKRAAALKISLGINLHNSYCILLLILQELEKETSNDGKSSTQLIVQNFSMPALHRAMLQNKGQILGLYDEMNIMYQQMKPADRPMLQSLNNGVAWSRNFLNTPGTPKIERTAFNMTGFIQPEYAVTMLEKSDPGGFYDRQLFDCPPERHVKFSDMIPIDSSVPPLTLLFQIIRKAHSERSLYTLSDEATKEFELYHDRMVENIEQCKDGNRKGIYSKAKGQCARLALVFHVIDQALEWAKAIHLSDTGQEHPPPDLEREDQWKLVIGKKAVEFGSAMTDHFIDQKFLLMPAPASSSISSHADPITDPLLKKYPKKLMKFLISVRGEIKASDVSRKRLIPPNPDGSVQRCEEYMKAVARAGFGETYVQITGRNLRKSLVFKKTPYEDLEKKPKRMLHMLEITAEVYKHGKRSVSQSKSIPSSSAADDESTDSESDTSSSYTSTSDSGSPYKAAQQQHCLVPSHF